MGWEGFYFLSVSARTSSVRGYESGLVQLPTGEWSLGRGLAARNVSCIGCARLDATARCDEAWYGVTWPVLVLRAARPFVVSTATTVDSSGVFSCRNRNAVIFQIVNLFRVGLFQVDNKKRCRYILCSLIPSIRILTTPFDGYRKRRTYRK